MKTACMRLAVFAGAMAMAATISWLPVHAQDGQKTTWDGVRNHTAKLQEACLTDEHFRTARWTFSAAQQL